MRKPLRRSSLLAVVAAVAMLAGMVPAGAQSAELAVPDDVARGIEGAKVEKTYLVIMSGDPVASYDGDVAGFAATRPADGAKLNPAANNVRRYRSHLEGRYTQAMRDAGVPTSRRIYNYGLTLNGFAARMTGEQAAVMAQTEGVLAVVESQRRQVDTISTPDFLGLTAEDGAWAQGYRGRNVIIGVLDSGIRPESASFANTNARIFGPLARWSGECVAGEGMDASACNGKLIGARWYDSGFGGPEGVKEDFPYEYNSALDADGHGTHTASTAGGNGDVDVVVDGQALGTASGMAPYARVAAYKVCWGRGDEGGCFDADSVAAVEDAIEDGVDVINFSISGTTSNFLDAVELAFLGAADAGVFVAASAGNTPGPSTVAHPSPWITTVAAGTHDRYFEATLTLGDGSTYASASFQPTGTDTLPLVYAGDVALAGADPAEAALCFPGTLDPAQVAGKMVLCERGVIARIEKSLEVRDAGGLGMILANTTVNSINGDIHFVPTIHVDDVAYAEILEYIAAAGADATGALTPGVYVQDTTAPQRAAFSSQGPLEASGDLLKPDIMAPGVDVLAADSPDVYGRTYDLKSGTSMSSPHIAGLAAVVKSKYRGWTPAMIKSALMTTADPVDGSGPFDVGSGHVNINAALDPGLVYRAGFNQYVGFICGTGQLPADFCPSIGIRTIDPSDLNQPNIAVGDLAGVQTVTRRVNNVTGAAATFEVSVEAPEGVDVEVSPTTLTLPKNGVAEYTVTFTRTSAPLDEYAFGSLTWSDGTRDVTSQLVVQPVKLASPPEVTGTGTDGSAEYSVGFGYDGAFTAAPHGLVPASTQDGNVVDDPANDINTALDTGVGVTLHEVVVPEGTAYTRVSLFNDFTDGDDDLDLYVFGPDTAGFPFVGASGFGGSDEEVNLLLPEAGVYIVVVHGWQTDGPDSNYTLFDWSVSATPADGSGATDLSVTGPTEAVLGESGTINASWSGLETGTKYLGAVSYTDEELFGLTVVSVDTN
jgi:hypothetical protein